MLVDKVRQWNSLYDTKSPDYRDQHMTANVWEETGKELKIKHFIFFTWAITLVFPITSNKEISQTQLEYLFIV